MGTHASDKLPGAIGHGIGALVISSVLQSRRRDVIKETDTLVVLFDADIYSKT